MTTKEEILAQAGEPAAWKDTCLTTDENDQQHTETVLLGYEGADLLPDGTGLYTADQVIAARKDLHQEIERLKALIPRHTKLDVECKSADDWRHKAMYYESQWSGCSYAFNKAAGELRQQLAEKDAEIERLKGEQNDQLDTDSDDARTIQHRELDGAVEVGQLLGDSQNKETGNPKTQGTLSLADTFRGDDAALLRSVVALIELDLDGALVPHGIGGHARSLLSDLSVRLNERNRQLTEKDAEIERLNKPCQIPVPSDVADQIERTDWTPEQALQFYADQRNFDIAEGRTRIIDNGAVASNALKHLTLDRLELKGDAELTELREHLAAAQAREQHMKSTLLVNTLRHTGKTKNEIKDEIERLFPSDTSALETMIRKAGECMRERALARPHPPWANYLADGFIRTLPPVKLEDLK